MKKLACMLFAAFLTSTASADVHCVGKINAVYKWNTMTSLSIQIIMADGTVTPWINMPTKSDEAMALLALSSGKSIDLYWLPSDVTVCLNGWAHNRVLNGFFVVANQ